MVGNLGFWLANKSAPVMSTEFGARNLPTLTSSPPMRTVSTFVTVAVALFALLTMVKLAAVPLTRFHLREVFNG